MSLNFTKNLKMCKNQTVKTLLTIDCLKRLLKDEQDTFYSGGLKRHLNLALLQPL